MIQSIKDIKITKNLFIYLTKYFGVFMAMLIEGFMDGSNSILLPMIKQSKNLSYTSYSILQMAGTFGAIIISYVCSYIIPKYGYRICFQSAYLFAVIGYFGIYMFKPVAVIIMFYYLIASGVGTFDITGNTYGSVIYVKYIGLLFCVTNTFYGLGSFLGVPYVGMFQDKFESWPYNNYFLTILIPLGIIFLLTVFIKYDKQTGYERIVNTSANENAEQLKPYKELIKDPRCLLIGITLSFYTICERSTMTWGVLYIKEHLNLSNDVANNFMTYFLFIYTISRLFNGYFVDKVGYISYLELLGIITCLLAVFGFSFNGKTALYFLCATSACVSTFWCCIMSIIVDQFKENAERATGIILPLQIVIQLIVMSTLGIINDSFGNQYAYILSYGFTIIALLLTIFLNILMCIEKKEESKY